MKEKILTTLFIFIFASGNSIFAMSQNENIAMIENHLFGYENTKMSDNTRLDKIETFVYGEKQNFSKTERLKKLNKDLGFDLNSQKQIATNQNSNKIEDTNVPDYNTSPDPSVNYPIVDNIENSLLKTTYKNENIYKRLDRLEQQAFGKTSQGSLSERVDRLSSLVEPIKQNNYDNFYYNNDDYNYYSPNAMPDIQETFANNSHNNNKLKELEREIFGKTYQNEKNASRLARLEKSVLHREFQNDPEHMRIDRLATVNNAQKSSGIYNENKLMKHLSTGVQIGSMILMLLAMVL